MEEKKKIKHIAIIMDGNRRWAKDKGLPSFEGHKKGYEKLKEVGQWMLDRKVKILTVYAFSTENWKRSKQEVDYLMDLFRKALKQEVREFNKKGFKTQVLGRLEGLAPDLQKMAKQAMELTKNNKKGILNLCVNYSGRTEIVDAVNKALGKGIKIIDEKSIEKNLYSAGLPDPDLIIRTSGEQRLSGFLTWQSSYSELYFTQNHWPDFSEADLDRAIDWYYGRNRRFGGN